MVAVNHPTCCWCWVYIPSGVTVLHQWCGRHAGLMEPGCKCCFCCCASIQAILSQNSIRFDAPVKNCPTRDNVRVTVDVSFTFHIGNFDDPEQLERDAVNFVYHLGPQRLEEMLECETEEEIRTFVYKYKAT